ncbi:hypothetical protein WMO40_08505 [Bacillaceae bacterium CLA-AA-H227]|nr:hypothetical protein [Bacillus yapensis]
MNGTISSLLSRKIISASIAGTFFAILCGLVFPSFAGEDADTIREYLWGVVSMIPVYLLYSFPVILVYGSATSIISDFLAGLISRGKLKKLEIYVSALFHLLFGSVLFWFSLLASIIYFVVDQFFVKKKVNHKWSLALLSLAVPLLLWIICMGIIWVVDFSKNGWII